MTRTLRRPPPLALAARVAALLALVAGATAALRPPEARAYANGVPAFVTDLAPYCAGCHSSRDRAELREMALAHQESQLMVNKHYGALERGAGPYGQLSEQERLSILEDVKLVDENTTIEVIGPREAKAGEAIEVTVRVRGGGGPLIGVLLVDADYRYQARPLPSSGWAVIQAPRVIGPDGQDQRDWVQLRAPGLRNNLSFVQVTGVTCDLGAKTFPESRVIWQLRAPREGGNYPIVACLLYGTEKAAARGWRELPNGDRMPVGGPDGPSGRIRFSAPLAVRVR
jgi:hypothetical protein